MIKNYFKIAFRNIVRHKSFAFLNIFGLAIGMAACVLLFIVVRYELSYDKFLPEHSSIYHVATEDKKADGVDHTPGIPFPALDALRIDIPSVIAGSLYSSSGSQVTVLGNSPDNSSSKKFIEEAGVFFADPEFFQIFQYKWLAGNSAVLKDPNATVLTQKMAEKYFGNWQQAMGQYIRLDNALNLKVNGILQNPPLNTDFPLAIVTSFITSRNNPTLYQYSTEWGSTTSNFQVFLKLPANISAAGIDQQLLQFSKKHYKNDPGEVRSNFLQPLNEVHFDTRLGNFGNHTVSKSTLWTLSLVGVFIIIMACINFINLSTAQAINRSKEIGIRKVLGSKRSKLFWQMMGETAIIVFAAVLLALLIAGLCLPLIKHVASIQESLSIFTVEILLFITLTAIVVTFLSGSYPSLILSGFTPLLALKNKVTSASIGGISLRRSLVVTQFAISQVLIIGTIVAISQMNFVHNADIGFNKDAVLILSSNSDSVIYSKQAALKQELLSLNGIQSVSYSSDVPSSDNNWSTNFSFDHKPDENFDVYLKYGDKDYFRTFGLQFLAGHEYAESDTMKEVVINETLMKKLGIKSPELAIGKEIRTGSRKWKPIVGVVKDFKTNSLREETKPLLIASRQDTYSNTSIKFKTSNLGATKDAIQKTWDKYYPEYANRSYFMDESIENFYQQENQLSLLYKIFAGIAILISCLGLYGLVSFMAVQRTKEVGVRKVLGASTSNIIYLFSKEFTILILIAFVVAAPVAWYLMSNWLGNFAYRINIGIGVFAVAMIISIIIAWLTVGYKSLKAASANPVKSLRAE